MAKQKQDQQPVEQQEEQEAERLTRQQCANRVVAEIDGSARLSELAKQADELYVAGGGKSDVDRAWWRVHEALETAEALGIFELREEAEVYIERKVRK